MILINIFPCSALLVISLLALVNADSQLPCQDNHAAVFFVFSCILGPGLQVDDVAAYGEAGAVLSGSVPDDGS